VAQPFKLTTIQTGGKKEKFYLSSKSMNTSRAWSPPASNVADAAALTATKEAFFIDLFAAATFASDFFGRCFGMGCIFPTGRKGVVNGAAATRAIAAATDPGGTT
jgi:hypothetical protein